jgi:hypothetical protein
LAVRGSIFHDVMDEWQRIDEGEPVRGSGYRDQASWNALLLRSGGEVGSAAPHRHWNSEPFPAGEVQFPGYLDPRYQSYSKAALTHNILPDTKEKVEFTFGLYMRTFYCDPTGLFLSMLEI